MPKFTIETTYDLPVYRQVTYEAATAAGACELALADDDWNGQKEDIESSGTTRITGLWLGEDAAYRGEVIPIPPGTLLATYEGVRAVIQSKFDEAAADIMSGLPGDVSPELQVAIDAALDLLGKAMLDIRVANAPNSLARDLPKAEVMAALATAQE